MEKIREVEESNGEAKLKSVTADSTAGAGPQSLVGSSSERPKSFTQKRLSGPTLKVELLGA